MFHILCFLSPTDLLRLAATSSNFRNYWTENPLLWHSSSIHKGFISKEQALNVTSLFDSSWRTFYFTYMPQAVPAEFIEFCEKCKLGRFGEITCIHKFGLIGPSKCGKSEYARYFSNPTNYSFQEEYLMTIGLEFCIQSISFSQDNMEQCCKIEVWDTAGDQRFRSITQSYYRGLFSIGFCFDMSSKESFNEMKSIFFQYLKDRLSIDITKMNPQKAYQTIHDSLNVNHNLCIIGLKKEIRQVSTFDIQQFLNTIIDPHIPFMKRKVAYFEQSVHSKDHLFYPFMFGMMNKLMQHR